MAVGVNHGSEGGGLAHTGRAGNQHHAVRSSRQLQNGFRQAQICRGRYGGGNKSACCLNRTALPVSIHPESGDIGYFIGNVKFHFGLEFSRLLTSQQSIEGVGEFFTLQGLGIST
jgi:hypothetical protein